MAKPNLRVTKWLGTVPPLGSAQIVRTFKVPPESLKRTSEAQGSLRKQFVEHKCKPDFPDVPDHKLDAEVRQVLCQRDDCYA